MKKLLAALSALMLLTVPLLVSLSEKNSSYESWKQKYGISYDMAEDFYRGMIFAQNLKIIEQHNLKESRTFNMGLNKFSCLTDQQFKSTYLNPKAYNPEWENIDDSFEKVGTTIDWNAKGKVTPVKDQGNCGSCWAFSAVGTLQSMALINGKSQILLSEQQLVDCSRKYGNYGCAGGFNYQGLNYVKDNGIASQDSYPYKAHNENCRQDGGSFKISKVLSAKGCPGIQNALMSRPIGVSVDAQKWSKYQSGVFNDCGKTLDHDVLLVGMSDSYWIIKNSWSSGWGEKGFIRLAAGNTCGICQDTSPWPE